MFTEDMYNILIINAMRRFMFTCAGTPLALPYQEFTKGMNPLAPPRPSENGTLRHITVGRAAIATPPEPI